MCPPGWSMIPREVVDRLPVIGPTPATVYLALASHSDSEGVCWPSVERLAVETGLCRRSIQIAVNVLCSGGLVEVCRRDADGRCLSHSYRLLFHPSGTAHEMRTGAQQVQGGAQQVHGDRAPNARGTAHLVRPEQEPENKTQRTTKKRAASNGYTREFAQFWGTVAAHKRKSKVEAARCYEQAVRLLGEREEDPHAFLTSQATAYYASPLGQSPYSHAPAVWLRQGGYDDHPSAWQRGSNNGKCLAVGPGQRHPADRRDTPGSF